MASNARKQENNSSSPDKEDPGDEILDYCIKSSYLSKKYLFSLQPQDKKGKCLTY